VLLIAGVATPGWVEATETGASGKSVKFGLLFGCASPGLGGGCSSCKHCDCIYCISPLGCPSFWSLSSLYARVADENFDVAGQSISSAEKIIERGRAATAMLALAIILAFLIFILASIGSCCACCSLQASCVRLSNSVLAAVAALLGLIGFAIGVAMKTEIDKLLSAAGYKVSTKVGYSAGLAAAG
jgi:hypothetical protein